MLLRSLKPELHVLDCLENVDWRSRQVSRDHLGDCLFVAADSTAGVDFLRRDVEVEPGEFVGAPPQDPVIVMGDVSVLHVRVDIDEHEIPRFESNRPARAVARGRTDASYPLSFVRIEPFVVPKPSLTGRTTERVDTRVLQVIYAVEDKNANLFVGQQVDDFIDVSTQHKPKPDPAVTRKRR